RTKTLREERCGTGYETVQNHRNVKSRCAQNHPRHGADFQAPYFRKHIQGVFRVRPIYFKTALDGRNFSSPGRIIDSRPSPDNVPGRSARQGTKYRRGAAGVADSHLAGAEEKKILQSYFFDETNSSFDGLHALRSTHGGAAREIVRSAANFAVAQSRRVGKCVIHTDVDHLDFDAIMSR